MRKRSRWMILLCCSVLSAPATAKMCTADAVPAATLLLPYFEVDLSSLPSGPPSVTTLLSINNATPEPVLAHVILWTDWAIPTGSFDVFLTGYDVETINLYDVFAHGEVPITADEQDDPGDLISPHGNPLWDGSFFACDVLLPYANPVFLGIGLDRLQLGHTGQAIPPTYAECMGADHDDNIARGYVTIDSTSECTVTTDITTSGFSGDYFVDGGTGIANNKNVLWGDYFYVIEPGHLAVTLPLVHIEADPSFNSFSTATGYTFYGGFFSPPDGRDNREPLGTVWAARFLNGPLGGGAASTEFIVWRDPAQGVILPSDCPGPPAGFPLGQSEIVCFDEQEDGMELSAMVNWYPLATQRSGSSDLGMPYLYGWCRLNLNHGSSAFGPNSDVAQSFVTAIHTDSVLGAVYVGGLHAIELANACDDLGSLSALIFADGFESGDVLSWSAVVP